MPDPTPRLKGKEWPLDESDVRPLRHAVRALGAKGMTLAGELRAAITKHVRWLEGEHNGGQPFPADDGELPRGRPRVKREEQAR